MFDQAQRQALLARWRSLMDHPQVKRGLKLLQYGLFAAIVAYLLFRFSEVGWREVINALPASPWFYLFFTLRFFALPISELAIYEMIWRVPLLQHFPAFIRKRVYNFAVMGYSGEGFLTLWARRALPLPTKQIVVGVKDNNLLSALTSNLATVVIVLFVAANGILFISFEALPPGASFLFATAFLIALVLSITVLTFRKKLIALSAAKMRVLMGVHAIRTTLILCISVGMYASAIPSAPLFAWLMFLALHLVLSRIPFIPNQDLFYLGAALSLSGIVGASEAAVAGMLLAEAGLSQLVNLIMFFATAYLANRESQPLTEQ